MKRIIALIIVVLFAASIIPAFAYQPQKEKNLIKIIQKDKPGAGKEKNMWRNPAPKVGWFQNASNWINKRAINTSRASK